MKPSLVIICAIFSLAAHTMAVHQPNYSFVAQETRFDARVSELISRDVLQLAQDIGTTVLKSSTDKAVVFSPLSIFGVLSMLLMGSTGRTYDELMQLLRFNEDLDLSQNSWKAHEEFSLLLEDIARDFPNPVHKRPQFWDGIRGPLPRRPQQHLGQNQTETLQKIAIGNGVFVQDGFSIRPSYRQAVESVYKSTLSNLDFRRQGAQAMQYMNDWVNEKTMGKITKLVDTPLPLETKLVIASALYFKAQWESTFPEEFTRKRPFYPYGADGPSIVVDMMPLAITTPHYDSIENDCQIIALPYKRRLTTMFIILPNNSSRQRLLEFQANMTADKINEMISRMEYRISVISIPKMHLVNTMNLKEVFDQMGVHSLFRQGQSELSLISTGDEDYKFSQPSPPAFAPASAPVPVRAPAPVPPRAPAPVYAHAPSFTPASSPARSPVDTSIWRPLHDDPDRLIFSRLSADDSRKISHSRKSRSAVTYKASSEFHQSKEPLRLKDLVLGKRITKSYPRKKTVSRGRRQAATQSDRAAAISSLMDLDNLRQSDRYLPNPGLFADEIIHKVDLTINEKGTEGGAVTYTTAVRTASVIFRADTPFMFIVRHDDTKLPLFYGSVFEPTSD